MVEVEVGIVHVKALIPVWIERLLDDACRLCLFTIDGGYGERIGESCRTASVDASQHERAAGGELTEDVSLVQAIGGDDCR